MKAIRWSDDDKYFWRFTVSKNSKHFNPLVLMLSSGSGHYQSKCNLRVSAFGYTLIVALPALIKPSRVWVDTSKYKWSSGPNSGYWQEDNQDFGLTYSDGHLSLSYGPQTGDSKTSKDKGWFLPWTQWRFVRRSIYGEVGELFWTQEGDEKFSQKTWELAKEKEKQCYSARFEFLDYDGEKIVAETMIEEREWRFGTGHFKWLSFFIKPRIVRSLNINFSSEVGKRKGSWKGGTLGHGIDMYSHELHRLAFMRYCAKHNLTYLGEVEE